MRLSTILLFAAGLIGLAVWQADIRTDIGDFFFADTADESGFLAGQLQSDQLSRQYLIGLSVREGGGRVDRRFVDTLRNAIAQTPGIERVWSPGLDSADLQRTLGFYAQHAVALYSLDPKNAFAELASTAGLNQQAQTIKQALTGPDPVLIKMLLKDDPMLLSLTWASRLSSVMANAPNASAYTSLFVESTSEGLDTASHEQLQQNLANTFDRLNADFGDNYRMQITGVPVFATTIKNQVASDIHRIGTLSSIAIMLMFIIVFRSIPSLLITALLLGSTVAAALLTTQWLFGFVHGLTLAVGITLIGVCVDFFIHGMVHMADHAGAARREAVRTIWPSLALGGATTLVGYFAVSLSGFPGLQQIAVFSGVGILSALLITRFVLPGLMDSLRLRLKPRWQPTWLLNTLSNGRLKTAAYAVAIAAFAIGLPKLHWSHDLGSLAPEIEALKAQDRELRSHLSSFEPGRFVLVKGDDTQQALTTAIEVQRLLSQAREQGTLKSFSPIFPWIAPAAVQRANQQQWNAALDDGLAEYWSVALDREGLVSKAFPALTHVNEPPVELDDLKTLSAWTLLSHQFIVNDNQTTIAIWLGAHDPTAIAALVDAVPGAHYFSQRDRIEKLADRYRDNAAELLLFGVFGIVLLLYWRFRSVSDAAAVLMPATLAMLVVLGGWGLAGVGLTFMHLIGMLLTAAVCVDYGIFFLENRGGSELTTYQAIMVSGLTTAVSFGCLAAADNPALHALAGTVAPGVVMGFLLCPVLLTGRRKTAQHNKA